MFYLDSGSSGLLFCFSFPSLPVFSRPLTEEEIVDLQERHYDSIAEKQKDVDRKIQREVSDVPCCLNTCEACWWGCSPMGCQQSLTCLHKYGEE